MEELLLISYILFLSPRDVGGIFSTVVSIDTDQNRTPKSALRYGFQKTRECLDFEKSYLCIQKCLDLNFDVAYADKDCKCTCHIKKDKGKYTIKFNSTRTKWKLGVPTTSIPAWAQDKMKTEEKKSDIIEINDTDPSNISTTPTLNNSTTNTTETKQQNTATKITATTSIKNVKTNTTSTVRPKKGGFLLKNTISSIDTNLEPGNQTESGKSTGAAESNTTVTLHDNTSAPVTEVNAATNKTA